MKKMGIFLAYAPQQSISAQGIGRLMAFIISGMLQTQEVEISIAIPAWYEKTLLEFFQDVKIDPANIHLIKTSGIPYVLRIRNFISEFYNKKATRHHWFSGLKRHVKNMWLNTIIKWLSLSSTPLFILSGLLIFMGGLLFLPLFILLTLFVFLRKLIRATGRKIVKCIPFNFADYLVNPISRLRNDLYAHFIYDKIRGIELNRLIKQVNKNTDIGVWYIPTLFWPEIEGIKAKKIVAAPDVVFIDFPTQFSEQMTRVSYERITKSMQVSDHLVCYSD